MAIELSGKRTFMEAVEQEGKLKSASDIFFFSVTDLGVSEEKLSSIYIYVVFFPKYKNPELKTLISWESIQQISVITVGP